MYISAHFKDVLEFSYNLTKVRTLFKRIIRNTRLKDPLFLNYS